LPAGTRARASPASPHPRSAITAPRGSGSRSAVMCSSGGCGQAAVCWRCVSWYWLSVYFSEVQLTSANTLGSLSIMATASSEDVE
jgi:hypothetical protein